MAVTPLPLQWLTKQRTVAITSAQETMESGSDIHRNTIGFDPTVEKFTLRWVAPPEYIRDTLYALFCVQDQLVGIYSVPDLIMGAIHVQPDGAFTWVQNGMSRWEAQLPVRRV